MEKLIQANENELKLTRIDCDDKQRVIDQLRLQLKEFNAKVDSLNEEQLLAKGTTAQTVCVSVTESFFSY